MYGILFLLFISTRFFVTGGTCFSAGCGLCPPPRYGDGVWTDDCWHFDSEVCDADESACALCAGTWCVLDPTPAPSAPTVMPSATPSVLPTGSPSHVPSDFGPPSVIPEPSLKPTRGPTHTPSRSPSHGPSSLPTYAPSAAPTSVPTMLPTAIGTATVHCEITLTANAEPTEDDKRTAKSTIASTAGVGENSIRNFDIVSTATGGVRRLQSRKLLASYEWSLEFDLLASPGEIASAASSADLAVYIDITFAASLESNLVSSVDYVSAVYIEDTIAITRAPSPAPSISSEPTTVPFPPPTNVPSITPSEIPSVPPTPHPSALPTPQPTTWVGLRENRHWLSLGCCAFFVILLTAWIYKNHEQKQRIGNHAMIGVSSAIDFILDVAWADMRLHPTNCVPDVCEAEVRYGIAGLFFVIVPVIIATAGTISLIYKRRSDLKTDKLAGYDTITLIFIIFTNPECVILLPWKADAYHLEGSPFPNKDALLLSMAKGAEDIPQIVMQMSYAMQFGGDAVTWVSIATTIISLIYLAAAKIIEFVCKAEAEVEFHVADEWKTRGGWEGLKENRERDRFLRSAKLYISNDRKTLVRYMTKWRVVTIGDMLEMNTEDLTRMGVATRTAYKNLKNFEEYANLVLAAHGQKTRMKAPDIDDYLVLIGAEEAVLVKPFNGNPPAEIHPSSSVFPDANESEPAMPPQDPASCPPPAAAPRRPQLEKSASFVLRNNIIESLKEYGLENFEEPLWKLGIRHPKMMLDLEFEDFEEIGVPITKVQLRSLHRIAKSDTMDT